MNQFSTDQNGVPQFFVNRILFLHGETLKVFYNINGKFATEVISGYYKARNHNPYIIRKQVVQSMTKKAHYSPLKPFHLQRIMLLKPPPIRYLLRMNKITTWALAFFAIGVFTSVTILSVFQILFGISAFYYTYKAFKEKQIALPKSSYWLMAFIVVAIIGLILNFDVLPHPAKNFGRLKYYLYGVAGIWIFRHWIAETSDQTKKKLLNLFFVVISVAAAFGLGKFFIEGQERLRGFTDTLRYGYGMAMILLVILSGILNREKIKAWFDPRFALAAFVLGFFALYYTYTRGALLGLLCGLPFVLYYFNRKLGLTLGGLSVVVVLTLVGFYLFGSGNYSSRFLKNKNNNSDITRRSQWKAAIIATSEKPILGWGLSNFHSQLKRIKNDYDLDSKSYNDAHAHNLFLEIASGTGIVGLILFLGWLISWAIEAFKAQGLVRAIIVPFGVCWVISSQFEVTFDANNASMIFMLYSISSAVIMVKKQNYEYK